MQTETEEAIDGVRCPGDRYTSDCEVFNLGAESQTLILCNNIECSYADCVVTLAPMNFLCVPCRDATPDL